MEFLVGVALTLGLAVYLTWLASRVERLARRAVSARRALEDQLSRRAVACLRLAEAAGRPELAAAAVASLRATEAMRDAAENDVVRWLRTVPLSPRDPSALEVVTASRRLHVSRQVYNDAVRDARSLRGHRMARIFRLAAHYAPPPYFDVDEYEPRLEGQAPGLGTVEDGAWVGDTMT